MIFHLQRHASCQNRYAMCGVRSLALELCNKQMVAPGGWKMVLPYRWLRPLVASAKVAVLPLASVAFWGAGSVFRRLRRRW